MQNAKIPFSIHFCDFHWTRRVRWGKPYFETFQEGPAFVLRCQTILRGLLFMRCRGNRRRKKIGFAERRVPRSSSGRKWEKESCLFGVLNNFVPWYLNTGRLSFGCGSAVNA